MFFLLLVLNFFSAFVSEKTRQHSGCQQRSREGLQFFSSFPETHSFGRFQPFSDAKGKLSGFKILEEKYICFLTLIFFRDQKRKPKKSFVN